VTSKTVNSPVSIKILSTEGEKKSNDVYKEKGLNEYIGLFYKLSFWCVCKGESEVQIQPTTKNTFSKSNKTLLVFLRRECMVVEETKPLLNKNQTNPF